LHYSQLLTMFFCICNKTSSTASCFLSLGPRWTSPHTCLHLYVTMCSWTSVRLFVFTQSLASAYTCRGIFTHCLIPCVSPQWRREDFITALFSIPILTAAPRAPYHVVSATPNLHPDLCLLSKSLLHYLSANFLPRDIIKKDVSTSRGTWRLRGEYLPSYVTPLKHLTMYHGGGRVSYQHGWRTCGSLYY